MELVIFIGLQASGKSTFYRQRFAATHVHVSMDNFRNHRRPRERQLALLQEALLNQQSVVVDNTNPTPEDRAPLIEQARLLGIPVVGYYFESRLAECKRRNSQREGRACVPDVALHTTVKKLTRPTRAEGFSRLYHARIAEEGGFEISDWQEDDPS